MVLSDDLDETQGAEAVQILHAIQSVYEKQSVSSEDSLGKLYFTLAMLYMVLSQKQLANEYHDKSTLYLTKMIVDSNYGVINLSKFREAIEGMA